MEKRKLVYLNRLFSITHTVTSSAIGPHAHFEHVIGYYFSGRARCRIGNQMVEYAAGDMSMLNPGEAHEDFALPEERDYVTVGIKREMLNTILSDAGRDANTLPYFPCSRIEDDPQVGRICSELRSEGNGHRFGRDALLRHLVTELSIHLLRRCLQFTAADQMMTLDPDEFTGCVRRALEYLRDTYREEFLLERVSAAAGLSKYHLDRVFKRATGLRPHTYVTLLRVESGKEVLVHTSKPIAEIALELGFADQSHFSNVFKQFSGMSPRAYRLAATGSSRQ